MSKWQINRFGLINFWYYDEEEFQLQDGNLLLRGANGSGKSVTMQSFIPLLLDGSVRPERLDPFGSRARRIDSYILPDGTAEDENTGYLFMELKDKDENKYISFGMGIRAKKGSSTRIWYFCLEDGRRIGRDFLLYKERVKKVPFTRIELRNAIGEGGIVVDKQGEYASLINRHIFGFESVDEYSELIKLLINLRSPKLSKDFKPSATYEILKGSLEPISDEELRPITEAVENMDEMQSNLQALKDAKKESEKIKKSYDRYNKCKLLEKINWYLEAKFDLDSNISKLKKMEKEIAEKNEKKSVAEESSEKLKYKGESLSELKESYEKSEHFQLQKGIINLQNEISEKEADRQKGKSKLDAKETNRNKHYSELEEIKREKDDIFYRLKNIIEENSDLADEIELEEDKNFAKEILANIDREYNFLILRTETKKLKQFLIEVKNIVESYNRTRKEYDSVLEKLDNLRNELDEINNKIEVEYKNLDREKEQFLENFGDFSNSTSELIFDEKSKEDINVLVTSCEEMNDIYSIKNRFKDVFRDNETKIDKIITENGIYIDNLKVKANEKQSEINEWKERKDPIYEAAEKEEKYTKRLTENGVNYSYFWKSIDFRDSVDEQMRGIIEEMLADLGALNSIVLYDDKISLHEDEGVRILKPEEQFTSGETLFDYLKPEDILNENEKNYIERILKSIPVNRDSGNFYLNINGEYKTGIISGETTKISEAKYIGITARENYRKQKIEQLENELQILLDEMEEFNKTIANLKLQKEKLKEEFDRIPKLDLISELLIKIGEIEKERDIKQSNIEYQSKEEEKVRAKLDDWYRKLQECRGKTNITLDEETISEALQTIEEYTGNIYEIENLHNRYLEHILRQKRAEETIDNIEEEIDDLKIDLSKLEKIIESKTMTLTSYQKRAEEAGIGDIVKKISELEAEIALVNEQMDKAKEEAISLRKDLEYLDERAKELGAETQNLEDVEESYRVGLVKEIELGYVVESEHSIETGKLKNVKSDLETQVNVEKSQDYGSDLINKFTVSKNAIGDYKLRMEFIFDEPIDGVSNEVLVKLKRPDVVGEINHKRSSLLLIIENLENKIANDEKLLEDKERELFKEILIKTMSRRITEKIAKSEVWVRNMNDLMESMDTNTIRLGLSWAAKKPDSEEQMGSNELVKLLRMNEFTRRDEDINKIVMHFKSKIADAKREMDKQENHKSFHALMKESLDYREWYEFKLFVKRGDQNKKPLTQNEFYKFSGGEKAMTMYVPLFAAVSARYDNASEKAPKIISLDEAFAGVDEKNISVMFNFMVEMGFDFVINSQVLWGDYHTIPNLAISELYRPNNSDVVTVFRYKWNGHKKIAVLHNDLADKAGNKFVF